jgi:hypothetical protein
MQKRHGWNFDNIPEELKQIPQWVNWKRAKRDGKTTKPPCTPTGANMDAQDPKNWLSFQEAVSAYERNPKLDGVGLVLTADLGLVGWDLDRCLDEAGKPEPWAADIVHKLGGYAEISPSGAGIRVFVKGTLPAGVDGRRQGALEVYSSGRYLTMTGNRLPGTAGGVAENQAAIDAIFREYFTPEPQPQDADPDAADLADAVLLDMARNAKNGDKFSSLWEGNTGDYSSQSEADLAFCQLLAFWWNKDAAAIDRIFRQSGLFRAKWDKKHGAQTYGEKTISKAIERTTETFKPQGRGESGSATGPEPQDAPDYFAGKTGLFWNKPTKDGVIPIRLTNFSVKIVLEIVHFDGAEKRIMFDMAAKLRGRELAFTLPASRFAAMTWPTETLGAGAIIEPGQAMKDRARVAIQTVSGNVPREDRFIFTGWHKLPTGWAYLHAGGAMGTAGPVAGIKTELGPLERFFLPDPPTGAELTGAVTDALTFFSLLPCGLGWPLFILPFRAVLSEADAPDASGWIAGPTGAFKSELAALVQSFFGQAMADKRNLPAAWSSTANALERLAFLAKDALLVVDDFAPTGTAADIARLNRDAERVLRGAGNRSGRGRMNADGSLRKTNYPRGLVLGTGEDIPAGHSLRARLLTLELKPGDVDPSLLTRGQAMAAAGVFNRLLAAFVTWTADRLEDLKAQFPKRKEQARAGLSVAGHARYAGTVADLLTAAEVFKLFALDADAMTEAEAVAWVERVKVDLLTAAGGQAEYLATEDPTNRFFLLLATALTMGRAYVADAVDGGPPEDAALWGWNANGNNPQPQGDKVGWLAGPELYLDPDAVFSAVQKLGRDQGAAIPISQGRLWKTLRGKDLLQSQEPGRNLAKKKTEGAFRRVIHLHADQIFQRAGDVAFSVADHAEADPPTREEQGEQWADL